MNEVGVIGHGYNTYSKVNKSRDELIDDYSKRLGFKVTEKENTNQLYTGFLKCIRIQKVHLSSLHLKNALQNKFLNLLLSLSSYTPKLISFIKMLNSNQIITSFGS